MASQTNSYTFGYPTPPPTSETRRRGWWSRPIATVPPASNATFKDFAVYISPFWGGLLTVGPIFLILLLIDKAHPHANFSIQSFAVSPSTATYHVDFLVKNPSSRYSIYYDGSDASVRFGNLNVAVFNITRKRDHKDHTVFSLAFDDEEVNRTDVVSRELDIKLRGKHKRYLNYDEAGHFDIRCQNVTRSHENIEKIKCHSCFTHLKMVVKFK